jgi:hypothetical protein
MAWQEVGGADAGLGNNQTNANHWLGTRNDVPLIVRTNNGLTATPNPAAEVARFTSGATPQERRVGIGTPTPQAKLDVAGSLNVSQNITLGAGQTLSAPGRLHIDGQETLYLLNRQGVIVSTAWGGNGNLVVQGNLSVSTDITLGAGRTLSAPGRLHIGGAEALYLLNNQGVIVSRAWGGNGNLTAEGTVTIGGKLGVFGQPPESPRAPGLAGGIHTWDLEAEGTIYSENGYLQGSDARTKRAVAKLCNVLDKLEAVDGVSFERIEERAPTVRAAHRRDIGVIAQDVETVFPELVSGYGDETYKAVNYSGLTAVVIEATKELKAENKALRSRIEALERAA